MQNLFYPIATKLASFLILVVSFSLYCSSAQTVGNPNTTRLEAVECITHTLTEAKAKCYMVTVPEHRYPKTYKSDPSSRTIQFPVAVISNPQNTFDASPLFYMPGGPGGTVLNDQHEIEFLKNAAGSRDLVLLEPRGYRFSNPALTCSDDYSRLSAWYGEFPPSLYSQSDLGNRISFLTEYVAACSNQLLAADVDPSQYNEYAISVDVNALRELLGYRRINLMGSSTGGGFTISYARYFGDTLDAVVADVPWFTWLRNRPPLDEFYAARAKYLELLAPYAGQSDGNRTFSVHDLDQARAQLDIEPMLISLPDTALRVDGATFLYKLYTDFPKDRLALAQMLTDIKAGNYELLRNYIGKPSVSPDRDSGVKRPWGLYFSYICGDMGTDRLSIDDAMRAFEREPALLGFEPNILCAWWGHIGAIPPDHNVPVSTNVPILSIVGELDTCCGRRWALELERVAPLAQSVEFKGRGHKISEDCASSIINDFLKDPKSKVDAQCAHHE